MASTVPAPHHDLTTRPRHSPTISRPYDPQEEHEIEQTTTTIPNGILDDDTSPLHHSLPPGESSLFAAHTAPPRQEDASARYDLPTYQANMSRSSFDFARMEQFAAQEKTKLDISPLQVHRGDRISGILNTGHDMPFRFSFYSNSFAATIHSRSLSELPADGQSFRDLFSGIHPPPSPDLDKSRSGSSNPRFDPARKHTYHEKGVNVDSDTSAWWLDVTSPTQEEMKMLSEVFSIHPLTAEDILMEEAREKIELFKSYYLVCFRSFEQDPYEPTYLEPTHMYIIVFREGILSFHFQPTPHPQNVRRRIKQFKGSITVTSDWISYALIDDITDAFRPLIQSIEYEVDSIDELVLILKEVEQTDMLRRIGTSRKKVMGLLRLIGSKADVVKSLAKRYNENWRMAPTSDSIGLYLSDIQDHLITMTQNLNHYEKILSRSHSNYLAQVSIEMTGANNHGPGPVSWSFPDFQWLVTLIKVLLPRQSVNKVDLDRIHKILDQPEHTVAASEMSTSETKSLLESLLNLACNDTLPNSDAQDTNRKARKLMLKLVSTDVMPKSLFITGVKTNFDPIKVGGFGRVFRGKYKGREVALKIVDKGHRDDSLSQDFCREALAWRSLKHRFILPLLGIFEKKSQPYLVSPFMTNGTISDWRKKQEPPVLESEIHRLMLEVAEGLQYIHSEGIIHGDLHGGNVLLDSRFHCQITDFGSTRHFEATVTRSTKALSLNFAAPELFGLCIECGQTDCDGCYEGHEKQHSAKTMETDIYAFGCLYYAIFFDAVPFHEASSFQIMRLVMDGKRPLRLESPSMDTNTWNLVQSCWETIPSKRLKIEQIRKLLTLLD